MRFAPLVVLGLCACYETTPVPVAVAPVPGTKLHVELTDSGAASLARYLGPNVYYVDGRLIAQTDTGLALAVSGVTLRSGEQQYWKGEHVSLPSSLIATVAEKKVSWWRSGILAAGVAAVIGSVGALASGSSTGGSGGHGTTSPK